MQHRDESWERARPSLLRCVAATGIWFLIGWPTTLSFTSWLLGEGDVWGVADFCLMFLWGAVGLYAATHAVRTFFWSASVPARLVSAFIIPAVLAIQVLFLWR